MTDLPSIQGAAFRGDLELLSKLLIEGATTREALARRLAKEDLALLDRPIAPNGWYDVRSVDRVLRALRDVQSNGEDELLVEHGWDAAERLASGGLYQVLRYLSCVNVRAPSDPRERFLALGTDLRLVTTLAATLYNFMRWISFPDLEQPRRYRLELHDAAAFPESLCWTTSGLLNRVSGEPRAGGSRSLWTWSRPSPELVVYRMTREL